MKTNQEHNDELLKYINDRPALVSLLYDLDMLPEQLDEGSRDYGRMLLIAEAWRNDHEKGET